MLLGDSMLNFLGLRVKSERIAHFSSDFSCGLKVIVIVGTLNLIPDPLQWR